MLSIEFKVYYSDGLARQESCSSIHWLERFWNNRAYLVTDKSSLALKQWLDVKRYKQKKVAVTGLSLRFQGAR